MYPNLPENRLIVNGVDITSKWGLVMEDGYILEPPTPKTYSVDIPGGNGKIDLTETLLGDTSYNNRKQEFTFHLINSENFEQVKTDIFNFLHGRSYRYQLTMDPGYLYKGRFTISSPSHRVYANVKVGTFKVSIDAEPFKYAKERVYRINAVGGKLLHLYSGRKRVRPVIETDGYVKIIHNNYIYRLPKGTWTINNVLFVNGINDIYINTYDVRNLTWGDFKKKNLTFGDLKSKKLFEWYKSNGTGSYVTFSWNELRPLTWESINGYKWNDLKHISDDATLADSIKDVYIKYEVGEL